MLKKLIKYDSQTIGRMMIPVLIAVLVLTPLTAVSTSINYDKLVPQPLSSLFFVLTALMIISYVISLIALFICSYICIAIHFYKSMASEEAYLTHTLPVTTWQLIVSKLITSFLYTILSFLVCFFSIAVFLLLVIHPDAATFSTAMDNFMEGIRLGWNAVTNLTNPWLLIIEILLLFLTGAVQSILHIFAAIALGQSAKQHRVAGAIGIYVLIDMAKNIISTVAIYGFLFLMHYTYSLTTDVSVDAFNYGWFTALYCGILLLLQIIFIVVFYVLTHRTFSKKLNLE